MPSKAGAACLPVKVILKSGSLQFSALVYEPAEAAHSTILALHGFPDTPHTFKAIIPQLLEHGFRVVTPFMRGYEVSSIPVDANFQIASMAQDVSNWLEQAPLQGLPVHLLGHDWGAVVGYASAALLGERIASFTALAIPPVGGFLGVVPKVPRQIGMFWYQYLALVPGLAERSFARGDFALIEQLWRRWSPGLEPPADQLGRVRAHFRLPGVLTSALRYYRALYSYHRAARWQTERLFCAPVKAPTLILNGLNDGCIDARMFGYCIREEQFHCGVTHLPMDECGHWLHLERPRVITDAILSHCLNSETRC